MQKERYRQFYQLGAEIYAQPEPAADAEIILITARLWRALDLANVELQINSLGTREEQATYRERLREYLQDHFEDLDEDSQRRLTSNPLRVLDSKNPALQDIIGGAPVPIDALGDASREHFCQVIDILSSCGVSAHINHRLVRGLDYYTRTVFEWVSGALGSQNAICGGGRYDRLFEEVGGSATAAVGFSAGIERIAAVMLAKGQTPPNACADVYLLAVGDQPQAKAHQIAERLRDQLPGVRIIVDAGSGGFKAKFRRADRSAAPIALVLGDDELNAGCLQIKSMRDNAQEKVAVEHAAAQIKALLVASASP